MIRALATTRFAASTRTFGVLMRGFRVWLFAIGMFLFAVPARSDDTALVFEDSIQPILNQKCGKCHSKKKRKGALDLSSMEALRRGGESGEPLIEESLDESYLWLMVDGGDMPPESEPRLTSAEKLKIRQWIEQGAKSSAPAPSEKQRSQHDILPIVLLRCVTCHGAQLKRGGLDMRTVAGMKRGGSRGAALVPGDADLSLMIQRVESEACPPRDMLLKYFVRRPPASELEQLREWINAGAPIGDVQPDVASHADDPLVSDEDRQHWAFQTPVRPSGNSVDEFIAARLKSSGLGFSRAAERETLIRRAYIDLHGLPPTLEELQRWREDKRPDWFRRLVDHLLDSPRYGERWGRYWLDVAGYADSEGGVSADPMRKVAWKYRDYVIRSFNEDKPYDRFLIEQLAGDELIDYANAPAVTEEMVANLTATGFLRMGIDQTGSRTMNFVPERIGVISDAIAVVGSGVMGLTMECARCHSHKYDAIPHRDYYRLKAVFQGALDEHNWLTFKNRNLNVGLTAHRQRIAKKNPPLLKAVKRLQATLKQAETDLRLEMLKRHYPSQTEADRQATIRALKVADNNRTLPQRELVEMLQRVQVIPNQDQPAEVQAVQRRVLDIELEIETTQSRLEPPLTIRALWDRGEPSPTYVLRRGEYNKPGLLVGPGVPSVLTDGKTPFEYASPFPEGTQTTGRRLGFARWLTRPEHPLTARVMVNRIWRRHFGQGMVRSLENFGVKGDRPSHPKLLDWLAVEFVERGWSIKAMHRLMMNTQAYQQTSWFSEDRLARDPQNRLVSRMSLRRMDAESLRDSLLTVAGRLDTRQGGPPDPVEVDREGLVVARPTESGQWRRSVYLRYRRTEIPSLMATFDYPEMGPNCIARSESVVSPQSLMLLNNKRVRELANSLAERVRTLSDEEKDPRESVRLTYRLALSRDPNERELQLGVETLKELDKAWHRRPEAALETYCHTILNSAAFLYVD